MPIHLPKDTREALGENAKKCDSRSLLLERFVNHAIEGGDKKAALSRVIQTSACRVNNPVLALGMHRPNSGNAYSVLYGQLQARLMVNMAGGVLENAGLCLDRFGMPYIPGSALKGCARRMALQQLIETDDPHGKSRTLLKLLMLFGWGETDWISGRKTKKSGGFQKDSEPKSDLWWAMAPDTGETPTDDSRRDELWQEVRATTANQLLKDLGVSKVKHPKAPWEDLPRFGGTVAFLPAYPVDLGKTGAVEGLPHEVPPPGQLELDVVTVHHREYYGGNPEFAHAPDVEEPVPNFFPAVAAGHIFAFVLLPLRASETNVVSKARQWLAEGLSVFGVGSKTNAGYGWFDVSQTVGETVDGILKSRAELAEVQKQQKLDKDRREVEEKRRLDEKRKRDAILEGLSPEEKIDKEVELMTDAQFDSKVRAFCKDPKKGGPSEEHKQAIVRALRRPRLAYWQEFKTKSTKGELAKVEQAIRQLSKTMDLGKMP